MNSKIEQHHAGEVPKLRAQQVYDWICPKIREGDGEYTLPGYVAACQGFDFSHETLRKVLNFLVEVELLTKEGKRCPRFRLFEPEVDEVPELQIIEPEVIDEIPQPEALEPEVIDEIPEPDVEDVPERLALEPDVEDAPEPEAVEEEADGFQSLVTIELDGWEIVDEQGGKWLTYEEIAKHLGYADSSAVRKIYSEHKDWFIEGEDTRLLRIVTPSGVQQARVFSFTGGLKICRYSNMPKADSTIQQLIDLPEKIRKGELTSTPLDERIARIHERMERGNEQFQAMLTKQNEVLVKSMVGTDNRITDVETEVDKVKTEVDKLNERMEKLINEPVVKSSPANAPTDKSLTLKTFPRGALAEQRKRMGIDLCIINSIDDDRDECIVYKQFTSEMGDNTFVDEVIQSDVARAHRIIVNLAREWSQRYLHNIEKLKSKSDKKKKEIDRLRSLVKDSNVLGKQGTDYV